MPLKRYATVAELPETLPVFPLAGALLLPGVDLPLNIFEPRYLAMFNEAMAGARLIGMIQPRQGEEDKRVPSLETVGCAGRITSFSETGDERLLVNLTGVCRFTLTDEVASHSYRSFAVDYGRYSGDLAGETGAREVNRPALLEVFRNYLDANNLSADWNEVAQVPTGALVNTLSQLAPYPPAEKQALLEAPDLKVRADMLVALTELALSRGGAKPQQIQ